VLSDIIRRTAGRARVCKHVTAHTLRHTAATWLRQATGDTRLIAEYLGHADLSTVSRYTHVTSERMHLAVQALADRAVLSDSPSREPRPHPPRDSSRGVRLLPRASGSDRSSGAVRSDAGVPPVACAERFHRDRPG